MTDKLISHLKNMNQVAGKFVFLKPVEEFLVWYGFAVSVTAIQWHICALEIVVSVCEVPKLSMAQATTMPYHNFELLFIHCTSIMV